MWNKFLTWLDGYDRKTGTYTRAISPNDIYKIILLHLLPFIFIIGVTVIITVLILK